MILALLVESEMYGYQISQSILERSGGAIHLAEGTLYPVLYRLLKSGYIADREEKVGLRRKRIYYRIQPDGLKYLQETLPIYRAYALGTFQLFSSCNLRFEEDQDHE